MGAPQIIWIVLVAMGVGIQIAKHGQPDKYNGKTALIGCSISAGLLYWGGFFNG